MRLYKKVLVWKKHALVTNPTYTLAYCRFINSEFEIKDVNIERKREEKNIRVLVQAYIQM
jgi:hypothetical protein